ncbi:MAG: DUF3300 domain-containing protein [Phycisphaerales bacterium]|nr:DUF3300 domain-containing protein [Phycisphaerales bacterium]
MNRAWCCVLVVGAVSAGCAARSVLEVAGVGAVETAPPASAFAGPWPREALTAEWMDYLMSPVALYPDPLLAQMLPAATYPVEVVRARRMLDRAATAEEIDATDLDVSVKSLARYPEVILLMDEHIEWTERVGQAFLEQQEEVMDAVQRLRAQAAAIGNLRSNERQTVYTETEYVRIVPVTEYLYIPTYDWSVVYTTPCTRWGGYSYYTYSTGCLVGSWLNYDCDWRYRRVCRPYNWTWWDYCRRDRHHDHHGRGGWRDREAFAYAPRAAERNGSREERLVRPEPDPLTPDQPVVRDERKPGSPGGRPRDRVVGVAPKPVIESVPPPPVRLTEPRKAPRDETPEQVRPVSPSPTPPPIATPSDEPPPPPRRASPPPTRQAEPPRSAPPAQRISPPSSPPPTSTPPPKVEKPKARAAEPPPRGQEPPKRPARTELADAKPRSAPTPVISPTRPPVAPPTAPPVARPTERPKVDRALPAREVKRELPRPVAPLPAMRVAPQPPPMPMSAPKPVAPRLEAFRPMREAPRAAAPAPRPVPAAAPAMSKARSEALAPSQPVSSGAAGESAPRAPESKSRSEQGRAGAWRR